MNWWDVEIESWVVVALCTLAALSPYVALLGALLLVLSCMP